MAEIPEKMIEENSTNEGSRNECDEKEHFEPKFRGTFPHVPEQVCFKGNSDVSMQQMQLMWSKAY